MRRNNSPSPSSRCLGHHRAMQVEDTLFDGHLRREKSSDRAGDPLISLAPQRERRAAPSTSTRAGGRGPAPPAPRPRRRSGCCIPGTLVAIQPGTRGTKPGHASARLEIVPGRALLGAKVLVSCWNPPTAIRAIRCSPSHSCCVERRDEAIPSENVCPAELICFARDDGLITRQPDGLRPDRGSDPRRFRGRETRTTSPPAPAASRARR